MSIFTRFNIRRALSVSTLLAAAVVGFETSAQPAFISNGLVGYYPLDGNANDYSGHNNSGTVNGADLSTDRFGNTGKAYTFNGESYIDLGNRADFNFKSTDFTLVAWIKSNGVQIDKYIVAKYPNEPFPPNFGYYGLGTGTQGYGFASTHGIDQLADVRGNGQIQDDEWHQIVVTVERSRAISFYRDGFLDKEEAQTVSGEINNTSHLLIGKATRGQGYEGAVDDVRIYDRALSATEVQVLYDFESSPDGLASIPETTSTLGLVAVFSSLAMIKRKG